MLYHLFEWVSTSDSLVFRWNNPLLQGTHWIRVTNNDSKNFALLPIFAFDDDYVPLSPVATPVPENKPAKSKSSKEWNGNNTFFPVLTGKDLATVAQTSDGPTSRTSTLSSSSSQIPSLTREIAAIVSPTIPNESPVDRRASPEVQILDITDLTDPGVRVVSKFTFKDVENKFHITIYGK